MQISLHRNATTTPIIRKYIQDNKYKKTSDLMKELRLSRNTINRWKDRSTVCDAKYGPINVDKRTTLSAFEESIVILLHKTLFLSLDDLHYITKTYINPKVSRSGLGRCLKRYGISNLKQLIPLDENETNKRPVKKFKSYDVGYIHIDVKYLPKMPDQKKHGYLFVAIDRCSRWVHIGIYQNKIAKNTEDFVKKVIGVFPTKITKILTDNGTEFTDRFISRKTNSSGKKIPSGNHLLDKLCKKNNIQHRLTAPFTPQTNGMVERFNRGISELLRRYKVEDSEGLKRLLLSYENTYNNIIKQRAINWKTPSEMLSERLGFYQPNLTGRNKTQIMFFWYY